MPAWLQAFLNALPNDSFVNGCPLLPQIKEKLPVREFFNVISNAGNMGRITTVLKSLFWALTSCQTDKT